MSAKIVHISDADVTMESTQSGMKENKHGADCESRSNQATGLLTNGRSSIVTDAPRDRTGEVVLRFSCPSINDD